MNHNMRYIITGINKWAGGIGLREGDVVEDLEPDCQSPYVKLVSRKGPRRSNQYCIDRSIMAATGINYKTGDRI